jgi:hypothetical protein
VSSLLVQGEVRLVGCLGVNVMAARASLPLVRMNKTESLVLKSRLVIGYMNIEH